MCVCACVSNHVSSALWTVRIQFDTVYVQCRKSIWRVASAGVRAKLSSQSRIAKIAVNVVYFSYISLHSLQHAKNAVASSRSHVRPPTPSRNHFVECTYIYIFQQSVGLAESIECAIKHCYSCKYAKALKRIFPLLIINNNNITKFDAPIQTGPSVIRLTVLAIIFHPFSMCAINLSRFKCCHII